MPVDGWTTEAVFLPLVTGLVEGLSRCRGDSFATHSGSEVRPTACCVPLDAAVSVSGCIRIVDLAAHATPRSASTILSHPPIWFQLANIRVTMFERSDESPKRITRS